MNTYDWIAKWAKFSPAKVAVHDLESGELLHYAGLNRMAEKFALNLQQAYKIQPGDKVAVLGNFSMEYIALFGAAQKLGFTLVPLNYRLTASEIEFQFNDSHSKILICDAVYQALAKQINPVLSWSLLTAEPKSNLLQHPTITDDTAIFILYTSGTTGKPKGALYTHKMLFWNSINTVLRLALTTDDITINCMPPYHTGGWNVLVTPLLHLGSTVYLQNKFDAETTLANLEKTKSTLFMAVPTMVKMMSETAAFKEVDLSHLRYFIVGGEPLPIPVIEQWASKNVVIRQGYGLTEVGPNVTSLHQSDSIRKKGSIGFPNFYIDYKIVDSAGRECSANQTGELYLKGPNVMPGYYNRPEANSKTFDGEWFKTGDLVRMDEEGFLYVAGRLKDMYISGGENVYPAEVEKVLQELEAISEAAVIGIAHDKWGETGLAFVSIAQGKHITEQEIIDYCKTKLAKFKIPQQIRIVNELPKNTSGKIDKLSLKSLLTTKIN
ncbi:MAG: acyl-CoA synthetase [Luteibaculaceae bacterium]